MINPIVSQIHHGVTAIALVCYAATCMQLLCYRRGTANYRRHLSSIAWLRDRPALIGADAYRQRLPGSHPLHPASDRTDN